MRVDDDDDDDDDDVDVDKVHICMNPDDVSHWLDPAKVCQVPA